MAFTLKSNPEKGPFPHKAGEFCGLLKGTAPYDSGHYRLGRPRAQAGETVAGLEAAGYRGLYLAHDIAPGDKLLGPAVVLEETPECLREPTADD